MKYNNILYLQWQIAIAAVSTDHSYLVNIVLESDIALSSQLTEESCMTCWHACTLCGALNCTHNKLHLTCFTNISRQHGQVTTRTWLILEIKVNIRPIVVHFCSGVHAMYTPRFKLTNIHRMALDCHTLQPFC